MNEFEAWEKILAEWKEVSRMKKLNQELYDLLGGALIYVIEYSKKNKIPLPNEEALYRMADRIHNVVDVIEPSTTEEQPDWNNRKGNKTGLWVLLGSTVFGCRCSLVGGKTKIN